MSILKKPYEISIWDDVWDATNSQFIEQKICVIGSDTMTSQSRAFSPQLTQNTNNSVTFSFTMYYHYIDNLSGETIDNPYIAYLTNERKVKLYYDSTWYDLIIKSMKKDSTKKTYEFSTTCQHVNELSKNGFNLTLDSKVNNNVGNICTLATTVLSGTDWTVDSTSDFIPDIAKETLVELTTTVAQTAVKIDDSNLGSTGPTYISAQTIPSGAKIYAFYSCCAEKTTRFQFYYFTNIETITKDSERVITNKSHQFYIDDVTYQSTVVSGIYIPNFVSSAVTFSSDYRGARYVFSVNSFYNAVADQYVTEYSKGSNHYYGFATTTYEVPQLTTQVVTNPNGFKSTDGWKVQTGIGELTCTAYNSIDGVAILTDITAGTFDTENAYIPVIDYTVPSESVSSDTAVLLNSGFYDNRTTIGNLVSGTVYRVAAKIQTTVAAQFTIGVDKYTYNDSQQKYVYADRLNTTAVVTSGTSLNMAYSTVTCTITGANFSDASFKKQSADKIYISINAPTGIGSFKIIDFQIFKDLGVDSNGNIIMPDGQDYNTQVRTTYKLYNENDLTTITNKLENLTPVYEGTIDPTKLTTAPYTQALSCEMRRSITAKESNYFNILQTLCETFECWLQINIDHNSAGQITGNKQIKFIRSIGTENYAGFRYGVNLKSIQRTDDSKSIVTKLIVKQNSNKYGTNGFCTIARAPSNETGENYIYNVDYYINQQLLTVAQWNNLIYGSNGHYTRLKEYNDLITVYSNEVSEAAVALAKAQSDYSIAENGLISATELYDEAVDNFQKYFGSDANWQNISGIAEAKRTAYMDKIVACAEYYEEKQTYATKKASAQTRLAALTSKYNTSQNNLTATNALKANLNNTFYTKISRFVQEGTWIDDEYLDDEKYYLDALSISYNSAFPKVTYSISVLELSALTEYQSFTFHLGDTSYIEDTEFFGYDSDGNPYREQVVLNEITYNLDEPDKNSIKVQNYKNDFQDLFKKVSATVQSVKYSTGAYENAADLASANDQEKSAFLQGALSDADTIIQNLAQQTVRIDTDGLTITDVTVPNNILRGVSGGILLSQDGGNTWLTGITAKGISAQTITSGTINTGVLNIMDGAQPSFRWDSYGLTAYDFSESNNAISVNGQSGVRFDRFGVYGFALSSGTAEAWKPTTIADWTLSSGGQLIVSSNSIRQYSIFDLTKQGFYLDLSKANLSYNYGYSSEMELSQLPTPISHNVQIQLGYIKPIIYNTWDADGKPYYDANASTTPFVKVLSAGPVFDNYNENFVVYDDGTVIANNIKLTGTIQWTAGSSPEKNAYARTALTKLADNTQYSTLPSTVREGISDEWHTEFVNGEDHYRCNTTNGGATWQGPISMPERGADGKSYDYQTIYYYTNTYQEAASLISPSSWITSTTVELNTWSTIAQTPTEQVKFCYSATQTGTLEQAGSTTYTEITVTNKRLINAYYSGLTGEKIAEFIILTNNATSDGLFYGKDDNNNARLYINASMINTGTLAVSDGTNVIFSAAVDSGLVNIGGFIVNNKALYNQHIESSAGASSTYYMTAPDTFVNIINYKYPIEQSDYVYVGSDGVGVCHVTATDFYQTVSIDKLTYLKAGELFSNSGTIGGWTISSNLLASELVGLYSGTSFNVVSPEDFINSAVIVDNKAAHIYAGTKSTDATYSKHKYPFMVTNEGNLYATYAYIGGGSDIAGWTTTEYIFGKCTGGYGLGLDHNAVGTTDRALGIGTMTALGGTWSTCEFWVTGQGSLHAAKGDIGGWIIGSNTLTDSSSATAALHTGTNTWYFQGTQVSGSGRISAGTVSTSTTSTTYPFMVTTSGYLYASAGQIGSGNSSFIIGNWDNWASLHCGNIINISGPSLTPSSSTTGLLIAADPDGSNAIFNVRNSTNSAYMNASGLYCRNNANLSSTFLYNGLTLYTANYHTTLTADQLVMTHRSNPTQLSITLYPNYLSIISGPYTSSVARYWIYSRPDMIRFRAADSTSASYNESAIIGSFVTFPTYVDIQGTFKTNGNDWITSSDKNLKHDIQSFPSGYDLLFDKLQPKQYKWNNNTSNRIHAGFIAQEIKTAIEEAGLTTQDYAAYVEFAATEKDGQAIPETCGIRYEEIIPLNTWQIQLLKPRVSTLEERCTQLEVRIQELEAKLNEIQ